jgi:hypothetical protein
VGTYNPNGRKAPDEGRPTWRPQDPSHAGDYRGRGSEMRDSDLVHDEPWRDRDFHNDDQGRRWEGSRGSELGYHDERYGQGQSGYSAGRHGEDRAQQGHMRNRNELGTSAAYDRDRGYGNDDRFSGRGGSSREPWRGEQWRDDRSVSGNGPGYSGYGASGGFDQSTGFDQRMGYDRYGHGGPGHERGDRGFEAGPGRHEEPQQSYGMRGSQDGQGYRGSQDSARGAHTHRGTGPHRGKGPMGYQRSDERIRELVCEALADDDLIDASQIHVTVKDGEVTLSGTVDDRRTKREAEDCVASVTGVRDVQVQLKVKGEQKASTQGDKPAENGLTSAMKPDDKKPRA